jgi:hypothetical protein
LCNCSSIDWKFNYKQKQRAYWEILCRRIGYPKD